jgi:hypothetical protein
MIDLHITPPDDDSYWQRVFAESLTNTNDWLESAKSIRLAIEPIAQSLAETWWSVFYSSIGEPGPHTRMPEEIKLHPVLLMLTSYAAENYLKARIVKVNKWTTENIGKKMPGDLISHDITELARKADATLNEEEIDLTDRLFVYAVWAGRYPAPIKRDDLKPQQVGSKQIRATYFRGSDVAIAQCLLLKLEGLAITGVMPNLERHGSIYDKFVMQERVRPW